MVVNNFFLLLFVFLSSALSAPPVLNSCISAFRLNLEGETHRSNSTTIDNCYDPSRMCMKYNFHGKGSFDYEKRTDMEKVFGGGGKCGDEHCEGTWNRKDGCYLKRLNGSHGFHFDLDGSWLYFLQGTVKICCCKGRECYSQSEIDKHMIMKNDNYPGIVFSLFFIFFASF